MLAALEDALLLIVAPVTSDGPKLVAEAAAWVLADDRVHPFSFLNVCDALDLDASRVGTLLAPWLATVSTCGHAPLWGHTHAPATLAYSVVSE
jgi:hypothetical protein